jgi:hypothetical protein
MADNTKANSLRTSVYCVDVFTYFGLLVNRCRTEDTCNARYCFSITVINTVNPFNKHDSPVRSALLIDYYYYYDTIYLFVCHRSSGAAGKRPSAIVAPFSRRDITNRKDPVGILPRPSVRFPYFSAATTIDHHDEAPQSQP